MTIFARLLLLTVFTGADNWRQKTSKYLHFRFSFRRKDSFRVDLDGLSNSKMHVKKKKKVLKCTIFSN